MKKLNILLVILGISFFVSFSFTKITDYKNEEVKEKINQINYSNDLLDKENLSFFSTEDRDIVKQLNDYVLNIEEELNKKSSSRLLELEKMINDYEEKIMQLDKNKSENEINILKQTIESLVSSKKNHLKLLKGNSTTETFAILNPSVQIITNLSTIALEEVHSATVTYFNSNGYVLAAELLQHMKSNKDINSPYKPSHSNVIKNTNVYYDIVNTNQVQGGATFEKEDTIESIDAFYALHMVNYNKTPNNTGIVISDRYDYAFDGKYDDFFTDAAVNAMYTLQNRGILTPYYVILEYGESLQSTNYHRVLTIDTYSKHQELYDILGQGDVLTIVLRVMTDGIKTIQTFGPNDTCLSLYADNNAFLASDDDSGFNRNALINYNLESGRKYVIKLKFFSPSQVGNIRLSISSVNITNYDDINKITKKNGFFKDSYEDITVNNEKNIGSAFLFENNEGKTFNISTIKNGNTYVDTYLYLVDPRRSNYYDGTGEDNGDLFPLYLYDDDSGGNLQAKIDVSLKFFSKNTPYLLISSLYNLEKEGTYKIKISGLDKSHSGIIL